MAEERPKMAEERQRSQEGSRYNCALLFISLAAPRWPQHGPKYGQDGPKMAQGGLKTSQDGPRTSLGPSWDHLGATLGHLVGFENGDFASEVLKKTTFGVAVCCRVVVCGVV